MAVFTVVGSDGTARCENLLCKHELYNLFSKSGCGRPLAFCPTCKDLYILNAVLSHPDDPLIDYLDHKLFPENRPWEWVRLSKYCVEVA